MKRSRLTYFLLGIPLGILAFIVMVSALRAADTVANRDNEPSSNPVSGDLSTVAPATTIAESDDESNRQFRKDCYNINGPCFPGVHIEYLDASGSIIRLSATGIDGWTILSVRFALNGGEGQWVGPGEVVELSLDRSIDNTIDISAEVEFIGEPPDGYGSRELVTCHIFTRAHQPSAPSTTVPYTPLPPDPDPWLPPTVVAALR